MKITFNQRQKEIIAQMLRYTPFRQLLGLVVRLVVAKHRTGVAVVVLDPEGRILLLRHVFHPLTPWGLPGGWLGRREAPADCALRELREETGLSAELGPVVHVTRQSKPPHIVIAYLAQITPAPVSLSKEIAEARWFSEDGLPTPLLLFTREAIIKATRKHQQWNEMETS